MFELMFNQIATDALLEYSRSGSMKTFEKAAVVYEGFRDSGAVPVLQFSSEESYC